MLLLNPLMPIMPFLTTLILKNLKSVQIVLSDKSLIKYFLKKNLIKGKLSRPFHGLVDTMVLTTAEISRNKYHHLTVV